MINFLKQTVENSNLPFIRRNWIFETFVRLSQTAWIYGLKSQDLDVPTIIATWIQRVQRNLNQYVILWSTKAPANKSRQTFILVKTRLNWNVKNTQSEVELIEVGTDWNVRHSWGFKRGFPNLQEPMIANHVRIKMSHLNDVGVGSEITKTFMKLKWWNLRNFLKK